jgi:virulence plasmid B protein
MMRASPTSSSSPVLKTWYVIHRYRPRIEGLFARIERWTRLSDRDVHWRSISKDNVLTIYGKDALSRLADPADAKRIFTWLISETRDDKGNAARRISHRAGQFG